jgi:steroid delta-isomerase-like uncharacterized protein
MSTERNKAVERRVFEELNKGNLAIIDELFAPEYVYHGPAGMEAKGPEGFKQIMTMARAGFPDWYMKIEDMMAEGDMVATRATYSGTHKGEFMGIPPTGKHFSMPAQVVVRFDNGREVEAWGIGDMLGMLQQLGIVPAMAIPGK